MELLIAMGISTVVTAMIFTAYQRQEKTHISQQQVIEIQQNIRSAMILITNEIRKAGYDPYGKYGAGIVSAGDGVLVADGGTGPLVFTYVADTDCVDNDNDNPNPDACTDANVDEEGELHTATINLYDSSIDVDNTNDEIQITAAGTPVAENIRTLRFTYFDRDGNVTADLDEIRSVHVLLTARPDERERTLTINKSLDMTVKCRNLGL